MTNQEAYNLYLTAQKFRGNKKLSVKFSWALMRTMKMIEKGLIEPIEELMKPSEIFLKYEEARKTLCEKYAVKDKDGNFVIENGSYTFQKGKTPNLSPLNKKHKKAIEERKKQTDGYKKVMKEKYTDGVHKVKIDYLPEEVSPDDLAALEPMIDGGKA